MHYPVVWLSIASLLLARVMPVMAEEARTFTGERKVVSQQGTTGCETASLTLRLQNGVISDTHGCHGTVGVDGRFQGSCPSGPVTLNFNGIVVGDVVTVIITRVGRGWQCSYHAELQRTQ